MMGEGQKEIILNIEGDRLLIKVGQSLDRSQLQDAWDDLFAALGQREIRLIRLDASATTSMDSSGGAFVVYIEKKAATRGVDFQVVGMDEELRLQLDAFRIDIFESEEPSQLRSFVESFGRGSVGLADSLRVNVSFIGKLASAFLGVLKKPKSLRWKDTFMISELAGVNSFWICSTIGILFGLILAFQSAIPMKQFGAEIYVASLVSMSLFRVLGPFIAAILFAARSGSAFAAEIGTMKVNEEIDALVTMGFDPVSFLALPRVITGVLFVPLLAAFVSLFGLIGMFIVLLSLGYPWEAIYQQTISITTLTDMTGGIGKSFVFGLLVAAVGCLRGLQTTTGSQAVGQAATKAVVSGIVLVVIAEGVFSVIFYVLDI